MFGPSPQHLRLGYTAAWQIALWGFAIGALGVLQKLFWLEQAIEHVRLHVL